MSLTDIRSAYRDVFQTLRAVGRSESNASESRATSTNRTGDTQKSEEPGVVVTLSGNKIESEEAAKEDPRVTALSEKKGRARAKLEELMKRVKLTRKIWQYQPKELAKQLVALAKQLKEVLDEYKSAQKELAKLQGSLGAGGGGLPAGLGMLTAPPPTAAAAEDPSEADEPEDVEAASADVETGVNGESQELPEEASATETEAGIGETDEATDEDEPSAEETPSNNRPFTYGSVKFERIRLDQTPEAYELRGDLEFAQQAKGVMEEIKDGFRDAKRWAIGFKQTSKDDQKFFEEVGEFLKDLDKELNDYEGELKRSMPPAIWVSRPVSAG